MPIKDVVDFPEEESTEEKEEALRRSVIRELGQVGNYALSMRWGDGHDGGIYSFAFLRRLGDLLVGDAPPTELRLGVDVGGTFTDLVVEQGGGAIAVFKEVKAKKAGANESVPTPAALP